MNEMSANNRGDYREDYRGNYRDYREDYRDYDDRYDNRSDYRDSYREDYRDSDYRRRDYDRRGGKINNRNYRDYRNYRGQEYYEELEMVMQDIREQSRKLEDISEMASNQQDKNMLMKIAQKEKENYTYIKQLVEK